MPRLNGREATRRIRAQAWGKNMVVIALTGWGQDADRRLSRESGCDEHLVKPVDFAELPRLLREPSVDSARPRTYPARLRARRTEARRQLTSVRVIVRLGAGLAVGGRRVRPRVRWV